MQPFSETFNFKKKGKVNAGRADQKAIYILMYKYKYIYLCIKRKRERERERERERKRGKKMF